MSTNFSNPPNKIDTTQLEIDRALFSLGLGKNSQEKEEAIEIEIPTPSEIFSRNGAGLEEAAMVVASLMAGGNKEAMQLKAAEVALRVHGIFTNLEKDNKVPQININIQNSGEAKTLVQVLMPLP